jgi:hypothetical protein
MSAFVKVGGSWRALTPRAKVGGTWRTLIGGWCRVAGVWRRFYGGAATVAFGGQQFNTTTGPWATSLTGAVGDRLVALCCLTDGNAATSYTITDSAGGTWTLLYSASNTLPNRSLLIATRDQVLAAAGSITVTYTRSGGTGGGIFLFNVTGAPNGGYNVNGIARTDPANAVPSMTSTLPAQASGNSIMVGIVISSAGAVGVPAGWTQDFQGSYSTPTLLATVGHCPAGSATQTTNWGSTSATNWCGAQLEIQPI